MPDTVYRLNKSFGRFSAGTKFVILGESGGVVSHCETNYPIKDSALDPTPHRVRADIPTKYLTKVRSR